MKLKRALSIKATWDRILGENKNISTESLLARVGAEYHCDDSDVADALWLAKEHEKKEGAKV
jgi:hypothetical protein